MNNMANHLRYLASKNNLFKNVGRANFRFSVSFASFPIPKEVIYDPYYNNSVAGLEPRSKYGGKYFVTLVPGAGIGKELADALTTLFYTANIPIQFDRIEISSKSDEEDYTQMIRSIRHCGAAIKGYIEPQVKDDDEPPTSHIRSRNLRLRTTLDLYVEVMQFKSHPALSHLGKVSGFDCYLIRPTIEGEFAFLEHEITPRSIESIKVISVKNTTRLANYAFKFAISKQLNNVILLRDAMHQAVTGKLFTETVMSVAQNYPEINLEIVTTPVISQRIISKPQSLGVIVAESVCGEFFGSVLTGLVGSRGMIARSCYGKRYAVFDPGSRKMYHIIAGKGIVNPTSMIMCGVRLLEYFGLNDYAVWIKQAVFETINKDRIHTPDIGGKHKTCDYIKNMLDRMQKNAHTIMHRPDRDYKPNIQVPSEPTPPFDPKIHMPQLANVNLLTKKPTHGS